MSPVYINAADRLREFTKKTPAGTVDTLYDGFKNRTVNQQRIDLIEKSTRGQADTPHWHAARKGLVTASKFKSVVKGMETLLKSGDSKPPENLLKLVFGTGSDVRTEAMQWGIDREREALEKYWKGCENHKRRVMYPGLFLTSDHPLVGASPDAVVTLRYPNGSVPLKVVEVKAPFNARNISPREAALSDACRENSNRELYVKPNHAWYYQMQAQMGVVGVDRCDLVVYTLKGICKVPVYFDEKFYNGMIKKVEKFIQLYVFPRLYEECRNQ